MPARRAWEGEYEMALILKILVIAVLVVLAFFVLTFTIYFFNLDMKMMAMVEPMLNKVYDKRKRNRRL